MILMSDFGIKQIASLLSSYAKFVLVADSNVQD